MQSGVQNLKIKRNGTFRARLVPCGYSQIPGVHVTENYSPVVHDILVRNLIIIMIIYGQQGKLVDVETTFLYDDLEEEFYLHGLPWRHGRHWSRESITATIYYLRPRTKCKAVLQESNQYSQRSRIYRRYSRSLFALLRNRKKKSLLWTICRWQVANRIPSSYLRHKFNVGRIWVRPPHIRVRITVIRDIDLGYNIWLQKKGVKTVISGNLFLGSTTIYQGHFYIHMFGCVFHEIEMDYLRLR